MSTVYNESTQEVRFSILQSSNSVVWNTITRHFLWSILYVIYNSYLKLLIWGTKPLMNFVIRRWLFCYSFFHGMQWNLGWLPVEFHSRPQSRLALLTVGDWARGPKSPTVKRAKRLWGREWLNSWSSRSQGLESFYSVTPEAEARRPEGTTGTAHKRSDGFYFILNNIYSGVPSSVRLVWIGSWWKEKKYKRQ